MISWALQTAISVSLLIVMVLVLRRPVANLFGARAAYALWLAPLLRALMPPIAWPDAVEPIRSAGSNAAYALIVERSEGAAPVAAILIAVWAAGALSFALAQWWRHHLFMAAALDCGRPLDLDDVQYDLVASPIVEGPLATGLVHPLILVPAEFDRQFTPQQQRLALLHEQMHHVRGDLWANAAALLLTACLWLNPIAHMALRAFRRDMEAACDESLLRLVGREAAPDYAATILRCAAGPAPRSLCALTAIDELKGRLTMLKKNHGSARRAAGLALASVLTVGGLALAAPATAEEPKADEAREFVKKIEVRHVGGKDVTKRAGPGDLERVAFNCPGEKFEVASDGGTGGQKENVKFVLCTDRGESLLPALEKAAADLEKRGEMPAERKADILSKMRAKIAELRARG